MGTLSNILTPTGVVTPTGGNQSVNGNFSIGGNLTTTGSGLIGTNLTVNATLTATSIVEVSTRDSKTDIQTLTDALNTVLNLRGVSYTNMLNEKDVGMIAEEVKEVAPDLVILDDDGKPIALRYTKVVAYLVEAIKELNDRLVKLENGNT